MSTHLNWGLLSTARINSQLIPAIRSAKRAELVAVASRSHARAKAYATEWQIPRTYGGYQALLDDPDIDVVYISLPNSLHAEWAIKAAQSGKHVLCEKPLATTVEACDRMISAAEAADAMIMEAIMVLYHPLHHRARQLIQGGAIGDVRLVRSSFSFFLDDPDDVRWEPALGGGSLWDVGSYAVSFIHWVLGEPERVFAWQALSKRGVDQTFAGLLQYGKGTLGVFDCGFQEPFRSEAEVAGTEGTLLIRRPFPADSRSRLLLRARGEDDHQVVAVADADAYQCEVEALTAAVLDGTALAMPLTSSRAKIATLTALYRSALQGAPQSISGR